MSVQRRDFLLLATLAAATAILLPPSAQTVMPAGGPERYAEHRIHPGFLRRMESPITSRASSRRHRVPVR